MLERLLLVAVTVLVLASPGASPVGASETDVVDVPSHGQQADDKGTGSEGSDWHISTMLTDASTGLGIDSPDLDAFAACWSVQPAPHAITAHVEWDAPLADVGLAQIEFGLLFPSAPDLVRGPSPLTWSHILTEEDKASCFEVHVRADAASANVHVAQKVNVWAWFT